MTVLPPSPFLEPSTTTEEVPQRAPAVAANPNTTAGASWEAHAMHVIAEVLALPPIDLDPAPLFLRRRA